MIDRLKAVFAEVLSLPLDYDFESLKYRGVQQWDSVAHMQIVDLIETEFDIMLETDDVIDMSSFTRTVEILGKYIV